MANENNKLKFVIGWSSCIFGLLLMIVFGVSSSVIKGTAAVSECPTGYYNASGDACCKTGYQYAEGYCCPAGYSYFSSGAIGSKGCYKVQLFDWTHVTASNHCYYNWSTDRDNILNCYSSDYHEPLTATTCSSGYINEDGKCVDENENLCFKCSDVYKWGTSGSNLGCTLKNEYTTKATCLVNNTNGYGCFLKNSQTSSASIYEWTNNGSIITSPSYYYYDNYDTEAKCLANNKCYSISGKYYWGSVYNPSGNGYTLASNYTTKDACLANNIVETYEPIIIVSKTSLSVTQGKEVTFEIESSTSGKFDVVSKDTTIATVSPSSADVVENAIKTIKVTGVKAGGPVDVVLTFTPTDTTKYKTSSKTVKVTVNKATSSGGYDPEPTKYTYNATFKVGTGETLNGSSTLTCTSYVSNLCTLGSSYTIPTATKDGHTFTGWDTSTSCSAPLKSNLKMTSQNVTYNACFTANSTNNGNDGGNNGNKVDGDGNVTTNSPTGDIVIAVIWFVGVFAIAYVVVNFRRTNEK